MVVHRLQVLPPAKAAPEHGPQMEALLVLRRGRQSCLFPLTVMPIWIMGCQVCPFQHFLGPISLLLPLTKFCLSYSQMPQQSLI